MFNELKRFLEKRNVNIIQSNEGKVKLFEVYKLNREKGNVKYLNTPHSIHSVIYLVPVSDIFLLYYPIVLE